MSFLFALTPILKELPIQGQDIALTNLLLLHQQEMELVDAMQVFTRFTVGDGLVSQVPALLIAIATGLVVTKSASKESLGKDVAAQIFSQPKAFAVTSIFLVLIGIVPGMPTVPFFIVSAGATHEVGTKDCAAR